MLWLRNGGGRNIGSWWRVSAGCERITMITWKGSADVQWSGGGQGSPITVVNIELYVLEVTTTRKHLMKYQKPPGATMLIGSFHVKSTNVTTWPHQKWYWESLIELISKWVNHPVPAESCHQVTAVDNYVTKHTVCIPPQLPIKHLYSWTFTMSCAPYFQSLYNIQSLHYDFFPVVSMHKTTK